MPHEITGRELHICDGAIVEIIVQPCPDEKDKLNRLGRPIPSPKTIIGQIDTGASMTCIHLPILVGDFSLVQVDVDGFIKPGESTAAVHPIFQIDLSMLMDGYIHPWSVRRIVGVDLSDRGFQALIGRDLLKGFVFTYNGKNDTFNLRD